MSNPNHSHLPGRTATLLLIMALLLPPLLPVFMPARVVAQTPAPVPVDNPPSDFPPLSIEPAAALESSLPLNAEGAAIDATDATYPLAGAGVPFDGPIAINAGAVGAHSIYSADFDSDGHLDAVSAARDDSHVIWYRNTGGVVPGFEPYVIAVVPGVYLALPADVNRDGKIDIIAVAVGTVSSDVPSGQPGQGRVLWFQNNGAAIPGFDVHIVAEGLNYPVSAQVGDFDGDGALDIAVASRDDNSVRWFRSSGGVLPTFTPNLITDAAIGAVSVDVGDVDGNGTLDVVSASENDDRILWYANSGAGVFTTHVVRAGAPLPDLDFAKGVHLADLNGDGNLDIAYVSEDGHEAGWYRSSGGNVPTWIQQVIDTNRDHTKQITSGDLDNDGNLDLIAASSEDGAVTWYRNNGGLNPTFTTHVLTTAAMGARWAHVADMNGDGALDIMVSAREANLVAWFRNRGIHRSALYPTAGQHAVGNWNNARFVTSGDLDGDGDADLVSVGEDDLVWHQNNGASPPVFTSITIPSGQDRSRWIDIADLDGDGDNDLVVASTESQTIYWYENSGASAATFIEHVIINNLEGPRAAIAGDLDGDGDLDVYAVSDTDNRVVWYESNGAASPAFVEHEIDNNAGGAAAYPRNIHAADIDGDGDLDLIVAAQLSSTILIYVNNGARPAGFTRRVVAGHNPGGEPKIEGVQHVWTADMDGDGDIDILSAAEVSSSIYWFENADGRGNGWVPHAVDMAAPGAHAVVSGDADNDGDMDIFAALEYSGQITWYESNGQTPPAFTKRVIFDQAPIAHGVNVGDIDGDGDLDVAAASRGSSLVAWFENLGGQYALQDLGATVLPPSGTTGPRSVQTALLTHRGRSGDPAAHVATLQIRFLNSSGTALTSAEIAARIILVSVYLDSNGSGALDAADRLLATESRFDQSSGGMVPLVANIGEPAAFGAGSGVRVFVVAQLSAACGTNVSLRPAIQPTGSTAVDELASGALLGEGMRSISSAGVTTPDAARFLRINEVLMLNQTSITDPQEPTEYPDWIEVYNSGPYTVDMSGMYLTDSVNDLTRSPIGSGVKIAPYGRLLFIVDGEPTQGAMHTTFRLSEGGERIALVDTSARLNRMLDDVTVPALVADQSYARRVDGSSSWLKTLDPTPSQPNALSGVSPVQFLPLMSKSLGC